MGTIWNARENYRRFDPSAPEQIRQFATPHLVIHSDHDFRLPVTEGIALFNVLQERGVESRFLNFPDENHWYVSPFPFLLSFPPSFSFCILVCLSGGVPSDLTRILQPENSLLWHQQVLGWINRHSGIEESNPDAVTLDDTEVPVVEIDPPSS